MTIITDAQSVVFERRHSRMLVCELELKHSDPGSLGYWQRSCLFPVSAI